jgi:uncharacterized membrane protein (UPF0127 family)
MKCYVFITIILIGVFGTSSTCHAASLPPAEKFILHINNNELARVYYFEIASSKEQKEIGLMFRTELPKNYGMIFDFNKMTYPTMWMKNTFIPLDMLFLDNKGKIIHIITNTTPKSLKILKPTKSAQYVVEINAGEVTKHKINLNDYFEHETFNQ